MLTDEERGDLVEKLVKSAQWEVELDNAANAVRKLREALCVDSRNYETYYKLLDLLISAKLIRQASTLLHEMGIKSTPDGGTQLEAMLLYFTGHSACLEYFEAVCRAVQDEETSKYISQALEEILKCAEEKRTKSERVNLLVCQGIFLASHGKRDERLDNSLTLWTDCCNLCRELDNEETWPSGLAAARYIFNFHFSQPRSTSNWSTCLQICEEMLDDLLEEATRTSYVRQSISLSLASS